METASTVVTGISPSSEAQKKILVVDDDPVTVKALTIALNGQGYAVYSAINGSEAVNLVHEEHPDMLLVDVCLPPDVTLGGAAPWDGFQVTRWLQHVSAKKMPAIIISATDKADYKKYAAMIGAEAFMAKPLSHDVLFQSIESALAGA
jgi:two-component system OmpR family response regulator